MQTSCRWLALTLLLIPCASARDVSLKWSEVAAIAVGHEVQVRLVEGATVRGQALAVRDNSFAIDIRKTSNTKLFPKGQGFLPRASVSVVEVSETHGVAGRVAGTVGGFLVGSVIAGALLDNGNRAAAGGGAALAIGMPVGGYFYGRSIDRKVTRIHIER